MGEDPAANRYAKSKKKDCEEVGIRMDWYWYPVETTTEELIAEIEETQIHYDAIMIEAPLPAHIDKDAVFAAIDPLKDVDGLSPISEFCPCTPGGIMRYLEYRGWQGAGKNVLIIGRSDIVGKPLAKMMTDADATVILAHSKTQNLATLIAVSDLIVCAVGKPKFLNCYSIHVPVIDVGTNIGEDGKLCGDCFNTEGRDVTPVPGGVGLLTRTMALENIWRSVNRN